MIKGEFNSFEEALQSVEGTKINCVNKFKPYIEASFSYEDLMNEAELAIWKAWLEWDPNQSKFNTLVYNQINWTLSNFLVKMNSKFRTNYHTTYELKYYGQETYETIKEAGKTKNEEFNKLFELDGSEQSKKRITKELFHQYIYFLSEGSSAFVNASSFQGEEEGFDIFETVQSNIPRVEDEVIFEEKLNNLPEFNRKVALLLMEGYTLTEVAREMKMTKSQLVAKVEGRKSKRELRLEKAAKIREMKERTRMKREQMEKEL